MPLKLSQEPDVVGEQVADVFDLVSDHAEPLDAQPERESGILFRIIADAAKHVRIDDPGAAKLNPTTVPEIIGFDAWFGEREERRSNSHRDFIAQIIRREQIQYGFQIGKRNILVDHQAFDCLLYTSPSPRDATLSRMPSSA